MSVESVRERAMLLRLRCFRDLNTAQLEDIVFDGSPIKLTSRKVLTQRILEGLKQRGLIAALPHLVGGPGGGSGRLVYHLTERGHRLAAEIDPSMPERRAPPRSALFIDHALVTAEVALAFFRSARAHPGHDVSEWEPDWQAAERLGSSSVVPDGHLVYATDAWQVDAFVEVDLGTERPSRFAQKIGQYLAVYNSGSWRARLTVWPVVLTVTPNAARSTALRRATEDLLRLERDARHPASATEFDFTALADLQGPIGPLGAIWQVAGGSRLRALIPGGSEAPSNT